MVPHCEQWRLIRLGAVILRSPYFGLRVSIEQVEEDPRLTRSFIPAA